MSGVTLLVELSSIPDATGLSEEEVPLYVSTLSIFNGVSSSSSNG